MNVSQRIFDTAGIERRFRRKHRDAIVMGVCAGVADYLGLNRTFVRVVALLLLWLVTIPALLAYLLLAWLGDT